METYHAASWSTPYEERDTRIIDTLTIFPHLFIFPPGDVLPPGLLDGPGERVEFPLPHLLQ